MADKTVVLMILLVLALAFLFGSTGTTGNVPRINECVVGITKCVNQGSEIWVCNPDSTWGRLGTLSDFLVANKISIGERGSVSCVQDGYGARFVLNDLGTAGTEIGDLGKVPTYG